MMKISSLIATVAIVAAMLVAPQKANAQTSLLKNIASAVSGTTATSSGQAAGAALNALYKQYKADGKFNATNVSNIMNLTTLSKNIQGLKEEKPGSQYYTDFAKGLVLGSDSTVSSSTSGSVTSALANLAGNVDLSAFTSSAQTMTSSAVSSLDNLDEISSSVTGILGLLK